MPVIPWRALPRRQRDSIAPISARSSSRGKALAYAIRARCSIAIATGSGRLRRPLRSRPASTGLRRRVLSRRAPAFPGVGIVGAGRGRRDRARRRVVLAALAALDLITVPARRRRLLLPAPAARPARARPARLPELAAGVLPARPVRRG